MCALGVVDLVVEAAGNWKKERKRRSRYGSRVECTHDAGYVRRREDTSHSLAGARNRFLAEGGSRVEATTRDAMAAASGEKTTNPTSGADAALMVMQCCEEVECDAAVAPESAALQSEKGNADVNSGLSHSEMELVEVD